MHIFGRYVSFEGKEEKQWKTTNMRAPFEANAIEANA